MATAAQSLPANRLAVIGGRLEDTNLALYAALHRLSGGRILVFATASGEPDAVAAETVAVFRSHGFDAEAAPLTADAAHLARDPGLVARVAAFGSVYFTGGDQAKIVATLAPDGVETPVLAAIRAAQRAGGLVAGSSAGAAMMSQPMILGGTSIESVVHGRVTDPDRPGLLLGEGLGFFPFGIVDQHFIKRGRLGRLVVAMDGAGVRRGFGVDENTALLVEGRTARVVGEYGVMLVDMGARPEAPLAGGLPPFRLSYLDDGDGLDLESFRALPGPAKRRVREREIAYRAPARSGRNAFGAYTLYDLMARLVLADTGAYASETAEAFDARSGTSVTVALERRPRRSRGLIATPEAGLRMTAIDFRCGIERRQLTATRPAGRPGRPARAFGMTPNPEARLVLLGSSPLKAADAMLAPVLPLLGRGTVGVLAAASAEPQATARGHMDMLARHGIDSVDLGVTIDTVDYAAQDGELLDMIAGLRAILLCGGNQIRLVETLLHRGEESAVLRAIAHAHARGAVLVAASGAASALSGVMIAGGSTWEALRYGVSSDTGHRGLVIQEGIGLVGGAIVDQNLLAGERLGRLVVACAEEGERYGVGIFEESAVIASQGGTRLEAAGRHGFVLADVDPEAQTLHGDSLVLTGVRLTLVAPGGRVDLATGEISGGRTPEGAALLARAIEGLARSAGAAPTARAGGPGRGPGLTLRAAAEEAGGGGTALLDLECARDDAG